MSINPWLDLIYTDSLICAKEDLEFLKQFLITKSYKNSKNEHKLHLDLLPQHIVGSIEKAKLLILSLNPGWTEEYQEFYQSHSELERSIKSCLEYHETSCFYAFDFYKKLTDSYWGKKLVPLYIDRKEEKSDFQNYLDETFCIVDFFPYHSGKYNSRFDKLADGDYLPTQKFVFNTIEKRIKNNDVTIILARSFNKWYEAIPALRAYDKCYECSNPQNPSFKLENIFKVTRTNVGKDIEKLLK